MQNLIDFAGWMLATLITAFAVSSWFPSLYPALDSMHLLSLELLISLGGGSAVYLFLSRAKRTLTGFSDFLGSVKETRAFRSCKQAERPAVVF